MRRFNSFVLMAAALAAGAGRGGASAEDFGERVRPVGDFARPRDLPPFVPSPTRFGAWDPVAAMRVARHAERAGGQVYT